MPELDLFGKAPDEPHLALQDKPGLFIAIPKGAMMAEVMNPEKKGGLVRLLLVKVERGCWTFRCVCNPECTVVYRYRAEHQGSHR